MTYHTILAGVARRREAADEHRLRAPRSRGAGDKQSNVEISPLALRSKDTKSVTHPYLLLFSSSPSLQLLPSMRVRLLVQMCTYQCPQDARSGSKPRSTWSTPRKSLS